MFYLSVFNYQFSTKLSKLIAFYFLSITNVVIFGIIGDIFNVESGFNDFAQGIVEKFFIYVIIVPIIETFIFNFLIQFLLSKFIKSYYIVILLASVFFGLSHGYGQLYMICTFFGGLIMNTFYYLIAVQHNTINAFLFTYLLHAMHNFTGFVIIELF
jgi:hypothetical protein